jgi:hypothetical protein
MLCCGEIGRFKNNILTFAIVNWELLTNDHSFTGINSASKVDEISHVCASE